MSIFNLFFLLFPSTNLKYQLFIGVHMKLRKKCNSRYRQKQPNGCYIYKILKFFHLRKNLRTLKNDFYFFKHPLLFFEGLFPCFRFTWIFLYTIFRKNLKCEFGESRPCCLFGFRPVQCREVWWAWLPFGCTAKAGRRQYFNSHPLPRLATEI